MIFPSRSRGLAFAAATIVLLCLAFPSTADARRPKEKPIFATSAEDPALRNRITNLAPTIDPEESRLVTYTAFMTGRDMAREWHVAWLPGVQNFLVNVGARKGGLCFQWANALLIRLDALKLKTIELHWVEAYPRTPSEHNVIVVTAIGQPFWQGILLDNWRYAGHLAWGPVRGDPEYEWKENPGELARRLSKRTIAVQSELKKD
jgi:hypothetical protein